LFGLLFAVRIARVGLQERADARPGILVADLFEKEQLLFPEAFRVSVPEAQSRWETGEQELARATALLAMSALDDLLGRSIDLLRSVGKDQTESGAVDTGVSAKMRHLATHGGLSVSSGTIALHDLCLAIRHAVTHQSARQEKVIQAWGRLGEEGKGWWEDASKRPPRFTAPNDELDLDDREVVAVFKACDRVAAEVNAEIRNRLSDAEWARLIVREYWLINPTRAGDPTRNVQGVRRHADRWWRVILSDDAVEEALGDRELRYEKTLLRILAPP
jgi:hypothetical protein